MPTDYSLAEDPVEDCIVNLIEMAGGSSHSDLLKEIMNTTVRLVADGTSRGDLKILNSALKELRYAFKIFAPYRQRRKVTIFGSARLTPDRPAYQQAVEFSRRIAAAGFMVITGAGPGIMQAGHEGAGREMSFGVNIRLPFEQVANPVIQDDPKLINFKYFFTRKLSFVKETSAIVLFPGGFGTHDEGFEALTLMQTGKSYPMPLVYLDPPGDPYWDEWQAYVERQLVDRGMVSPDDRNLFTVTDDIDLAVREIEAFYSNYHSLRYVRDVLVLRLERALPEEEVEGLSDEFGDILASGKIVQRGPFAQEANEPEISHLPRLALKFDRHHFGRLRALIDRVNGWDREKGVQREA
ncbi:MAG: LOG family protein [Planctomycetota bacterium]|jgi:uncharacterized protein (TIGR00730 family)